MSAARLASRPSRLAFASAGLRPPASPASSASPLRAPRRLAPLARGVGVPSANPPRATPTAPDAHWRGGHVQSRRGTAGRIRAPDHGRAWHLPHRSRCASTVRRVRPRPPRCAPPFSPWTAASRQADRRRTVRAMRPGSEAWTPACPIAPVLPQSILRFGRYRPRCVVAALGRPHGRRQPALRPPGRTGLPVSHRVRRLAIATVTARLRGGVD